MQLPLQAGGSVEYSQALQQYLPAQLPPGTFAAGRLNGVYDADRAADGREEAGTHDHDPLDGRRHPRRQDELEVERDFPRAGVTPSG